MSKFPKPPLVLLSADAGTALLKGFISECNELGWKLINLRFAFNYIPSTQTPIGAIIATPLPKKDLDRVRKLGIPIVNLSSVHQEGFEDQYQLLEDRYAAGCLAADAFAERGFTDLGGITFNQDGSKDPLHAGFRDQAEARGCTVRFGLIERGVDDVDGTRAYEQYLKKISTYLKGIPMPCGILAYNYGMALRLLNACDMAGLAVPEQVAIICRGNSEDLCETAPVQLSAIDMNEEEQARQAIKILNRLAKGEEISKKERVIPVKGFVERHSTDILAVPDPRVATAIRFIWDHLSWPLTVEDVANEVNTSYNTLERAFKRCLGRTVNGELRRKRLEACKEMLRSTDMHLGQIAKAIGLQSRRHLHYSFKDAFGMTPTEYRKSKKPTA